MAVAYNNPSIVREGMTLCIDPANPKSYTGSDANIKDLVTGQNATMFGQSYNNGVLEFPNTGAGRINLPSVEIYTVSMWVYMYTTILSTYYLLDSRTGETNGYIWYGALGSTWSAGSFYRNGDLINSGSVTRDHVFNTKDVWLNLVNIASVLHTDDMNLLSRYSNAEGLYCKFGFCSVYNRALSAQEIKQNFEALRGRFGI